MFRKQQYALIMALCAVPMISSALPIKNVTTEGQFNQILQNGANSRVVVAEFLSPECIHCKDFERTNTFPILAGEMSGRSGSAKVQFVTINIDQAQGLKRAYTITGTPTFVIFKDGSEKRREVGVILREPLKRMILEVAHTED